MKKLCVRFGALLTLAFAAVGCVNEDPGYVEPVQPEATDMGFLTLADVNMELNSETDHSTEDLPVETVLSRADASNPTGATRGMEVSLLDDYRVVIQGRKSTGAVFKGTYGELKTVMGDTGLEVPVDTYTIAATSNISENGIPDDVQAEPSYRGEITGVVVNKEESTTVDAIVCKLQNIKITLSVAADLYEKFEELESGEKIEASIYYGEDKETATVRWDVPAGWDWTLPDPAPVYFPALNADGYNKLHISFYAKLNGSLIPMNKDITDVLKGQRRRIHVVQTYDTDGNLTFDAVVSSLVEDETITVGDGGVWSELRYDDPSVAGPSIRWADGSELPESIVLGGGALQNVVLRAPNGIEKVALEYRTTNPDMEWYGGGLNTDDLCTGNGNPALGHWGIPYGSDLAGRQQAEFDLHRLAETIGSFDGEYTFTFTVTDRKGLSCRQTLRFIVGSSVPQVIWEGGTLYDDEGFNDDGTEKPDADYIDMYEGMAVELRLSASPYFESIFVKISSELLNADELGGIGLPAEFDLCNLQDFNYKGTIYTKEVLEETLKDKLKLVTKVNNELKAEKEVTFCISDFMPMLLMLGNGRYQFALTVVDANGRSTTKYLRLQTPAK